VTYMSMTKQLETKTSLEIKFVSKGWGFEKWIVNCDEYCGKLLYFVKGKRCSWHYHKLKDEVFYIQSGKIQVLYSEDDSLYSDGVLVAKSATLCPGDNFHVYRGLRHQMIALEDTELFEFSTQHFDEDSYRILKGD
jgi:quercetin dioxygenase-like cupin family protein